ncbi:MAG: CHAP domain-containing protein [Lachnospiraceae bacterium]|nr:CHAP domain-containing protein [Lachnospiraceae bacterium]
MANSITAHTNIGYCRGEVRSVCRDLKKTVTDLVATNLLTLGSPAVRLQGMPVQTCFREAEKHMTEANRAANALAGVRKNPKEDAASYSVTCGSGNFISVNTDGVTALTNKIAMQVERLERVEGRLQESQREFENLKVTDQLLSTMGAIDILFPVWGTLTRGAAVVLIIKSGKDSLKAARRDVSRLISYFKALNKGLLKTCTEITGCEETVRKGLFEDKIKQTSQITADHKPSRNQIRKQAEELEQLQAEHIAIYGVPSKELAAEIARLKEFYDFGTIMQKARKEKLGQKGKEFKDWFYSHYGGLDPKGDFAWCDRFSSWMVGQFGKKLPRGGCGAQRSYFKERGGLHTEAGYKPKSGDVVFFDWGKDGSINHVGVIYVDPKTGELYVLHGNFGGKVSYNKLSDVLRWNNGKVAGYGDPNTLPDL